MTTLLLCALATPVASAATVALEEATIEQLNAAFAAGKLTSEKLVSMYLKRIEAYDKKGPEINTVITLNPKAVEMAKALDKERKESGPRSPLHGIPIVLKDNFDTFDLPTTAGSSLLKGSIPPDDAFVVKKLRDAGAIILAKVNLSEFASGSGGPNGFSSMGGQTLNPHDLTKGPAGSSGGTGAAIAATFAQFGLGTDTGGSIRGPSSVNGIAGLKPTWGLMSRDGIVPLTLSYDTGGPMARSVYDVAVSLGVMTGVDSADAATQGSAGKFETDYTKYLKKGSLKGARIGVARDYFGQSVDVDYVMEQSIAQLKALGATVVDVKFPEYLLGAMGSITPAISGREFKVHVSEYLATLKPEYPHSLAELIAKAEAPGSGYTNPWRLNAMKNALATKGGLEDPVYQVQKKDGLALIRNSMSAIFEQNKLDAIVYPTAPRAAQPIGPVPEPATPARSPSSVANRTGFPDLIVPAGMTPQGLPVTISFFGPAFSEPKLFAYGYDFEQATKARVLPKYTPKLSGEMITY